MAQWSRDGKTFDTEPPWWFSKALYVTLILTLSLLIGVTLRSWPLATLGVVLPVVYAGPVIAWERRHRVK